MRLKKGQKTLRERRILKLKKMTVLFFALLFSLALGIVYADDAPPLIEPSKSLTEILKEPKGGKKAAQKPAAKKKAPKKTAGGKKKADKAAK